MNKGWLPGKLVVVTGASRGIGGSTAIALAERGARVIVTARDGERLEAVAQRIREAGGQAEPVAADLAVPGATTALFGFIDTIGPIDGLVACAARFQRASIAETEPAVWDSILDLNLRAVWECGRQAFTRMQARKESGGRIITLGSLSGVSGTEKFPGLAAYNISKYGVIGLTEALAVEGRSAAISAVCISPGAVDTDMLRAAHPTMKALLTPEHVGDLIADLLDSSQFPALSGSNIPLFSNS